jgi:hypothetical protein
MATNEIKAPSYIESKRLWDSAIERLSINDSELNDHELELVEQYCRVAAYSRKVDLEAVNTPTLDDNGKVHPIHALATSLQNSFRASHKAIESVIESRLKNPSIGRGKGQAGVRKSGARDGVPSLVASSDSGISWLDEARAKSKSN